MERLTSSAPPDGFAQTFHFSTDSVPAQERFAAWQPVLHSRFVQLDVEFLTGNTSFRSDGVRFPSLGVVAADTAPQRIARRRGNLGDGNDSLRLVLLRQTSGPALVTQGRREATVASGEAFFVSNADVHMAVYPQGQHIVSLLLSRAALGPLLRDFDSAFVRPIPRQTEALGLLLAYADTLLTRPPATPELCHIAVAHVYDLTALALGATRDAAHAAKARGFRAARLNAVKSAILVDLASPGLSIEQVASGLRMSPRYIQMLFHDEETTFSEFIVGQRLARAWRVLADQRFDDRSITSIAFDCGFSDLSYFNRIFRKRFSCTPSEVRLQCARNNGAG
jgi:AraC-like DNA-binding protein